MVWFFEKKTFLRYFANIIYNSNLAKDFVETNPNARFSSCSTPEEFTNSFAVAFLVSKYGKKVWNMGWFLS